MSFLSKCVSAIHGFLELRLLPQQSRQMVNSLNRLNQTIEKIYRISCENLRSDNQSSKPNTTELSPMLEDFGFKGYSQNDEDGILHEIFRRVGVTSRTFVEFGAGLGLENNTVFLLCQGWRGLWIDGSPLNCAEIKGAFSAETQSGKLVVLEAMLSIENINSEISQAGFSGEVDLLSIDVDGNDYHLWQALTVIQPRVIVIEYNGFVPPPVAWVMPYNPSHVWDGISTAIGASVQAIADLAADRGYQLVCCNRSGLNAFLVRADLATHFNSDRSVAQMFHYRKWWHDDFFRRGQPPVGVGHSVDVSLSEPVGPALMKNAASKTEGTNRFTARTL